MRIPAPISKRRSILVSGGVRNDTMKQTYVLVDFENVQPKKLSAIGVEGLRLYMFVGASQAKVPFDLASTLQALGDRAEYVKINGNGRNALDFHITYYLGKLVAQDPQGAFYVVSKDTGFDPLIKYLRSQDIGAERVSDLGQIVTHKISSAASIDSQIATIVKNLVALGNSRPRKVSTLTNTINSLFLKQIESDAIDALVEELARRKLIERVANKVSYNLS